MDNILELVIHIPINDDVTEEEIIPKLHITSHEYKEGIEIVRLKDSQDLCILNNLDAEIVSAKIFQK